MFSFAKHAFYSFLLYTVVLSSGSQAQSLSSDEMVQSLAPGTAGPVVSALKQQGALVVDYSTQIPTMFDFPSINVSVAFDEGSHLLTAEGMTALRSVAFALKDERLKDQVFQVGGHVVLPNDPNSANRLSVLRANSVTEHLTGYYEINPTQLIAVGYGAIAPVDTAVLNSPLNSRIEFTNVLAR